MLAGGATQASFVTCLDQELLSPPMAWVAFGPAVPIGVLSCRFDRTIAGGRYLLRAGIADRATAYVANMTADKSETWPDMRDAFDRLQADFDQNAEEFASIAARAVGDTDFLAGEGHALMEHCVARFEATIAQAFEQGAPTTGICSGQMKAMLS